MNYFSSIFALVIFSSFTKDIPIIVSGEENFSIPVFDLTGNNSIPVFDLTAPICIADTSNISQVTVTCDYSLTVPTDFNITHVESNLFGGPTCNETVPKGIVKTDSILDISDNSTYQVVFDIYTNAAVAGDNVNFCLRTHLMDINGYEMNYQGELLQFDFDFDGNFKLSYSTTEFQGISGETASLGTKEFTVEVYRCTKNKNRNDNFGPLEVGNNLYICVESRTDGIVIAEITDFTAIKKDTSYKAVDKGNEDSNTFVQGEGTGIVVIGTRPRTSLFEDSSPITIQGSSILAASKERYLASDSAEKVNDDRASSTSFEIEVQIIGYRDDDSSAAVVAAKNALSSICITFLCLIAAAFSIF